MPPSQVLMSKQVLLPIRGKPPILRPKQRKEKFKTKQTTQGNEYPEKRYNQ